MSVENKEIWNQSILVQDVDQAIKDFGETQKDPTTAPATNHPALGSITSNISNTRRRSRRTWQKRILRRTK